MTIYMKLSLERVRWSKSLKMHFFIEIEVTFNNIYF